MAFCNETHYEIDEEPLFHSVTFHHIGLIVSAVFALISVIISLFLIFRHATHYLRPFEQRHIIRILFMIPIYATVSFLSYLYYHHSIYFEVLRDCYEAFAIASFFTLLCHYVAPNLHDQKEYFRTLKPKNWVWPMGWFQKCTGGKERGWLRRPQSGLTWFNVIWLCIFQYCFIRVFFTIVSVITQAAGRYCETSYHPAFAHVWVVVFEVISVTIAMYCLIQFYIQLKDDLASHRPFLKVLCIKLVIFFSFWQTILIGFLSAPSGPLKPTPQISYPDIKIGIPSMLLCIEMALFAIMHLFAFPWKEYSLHHRVSAIDTSTQKYKGGPLGLLALLDAFNPWDIVKASARGFRWLFVGRRNRRNDRSYQPQPLKVSGQQFSGVTFAGNGEAATEMRAGVAPAQGQRETAPEDRVGLLSHAQSNPTTNTTATTNAAMTGYARPGILRQDSDGDVAMLTPASERQEPQYGRFEVRDTGYHGAAPSPLPTPYPLHGGGQESGVIGGRQGGQALGQQWDMFGGARAPGR